MNTILTLLLVLHILCGFTALITGGIASLTKKGASAHRLAGRWYFGSMTGVFLTSVCIALLKELAFLFMVGFFSYYLVVRGYRQLYLKGLGRGQRVTPLDWSISGTALTFGAALLGWALFQKFSGVSFWPVPATFGAISLGFALADIRLYLQGPKTKTHWLTGHISGMGGGYIATWTAFIVTNVHFLPPVITWLAPTVIGSVLIGASFRKYVKQPAKKTSAPLPA